MTPFSSILNYVADAPKSAALYTQLLGMEPVEASVNFVMFALPNGTALGLWARNDVEPKATLPGGTEIPTPHHVVPQYGRIIRLMIAGTF